MQNTREELKARVASDLEVEEADVSFALLSRAFFSGGRPRANTPREITDKQYSDGLAVCASELGVELPKEFSKGKKKEKSGEKKGSKPKEKGKGTKKSPSSGTSVQHTPKRSKQDRKDLDWLAAVVARDAELRQAELDGNPFKPDHFKQDKFNKTRVIYDHPFADIIDDPDVIISTPYRDYEKAIEDGVNVERWGGRFLELVRSKVEGLWLAPTTCTCGKLLVAKWVPMGLIKAMIRGEVALPGAEPTDGQRLFRYPTRHEYCQFFEEKRTAIAVALQGKDGDEAAAFREEQYRLLLEEAWEKFEERGVTRQELVYAFRKIILGKMKKRTIK